jgi:hypothetical protein
LKLSARLPRPSVRTSLTLLSATGLIGAAAAITPHLATSGHTSTRIRQAAATSASVTTDMGPIKTNSVSLKTGPGGAYPAATFAQPFTAYVVSCFSTPGISPGSTGPYSISDLSTVWYLLASPATPTRGIGYIQATNPANQFSAASTSIPDQVGRCASDPPPPAPPSSSTGEAVTAQTPQKCARGILSSGANIISVHSNTGHLDIEFTGALPVPMSVDVQDLSTGQGGSGLALSDQKATYHFTEDKGTTFGDHTLSVNVDGVLGGANGEEAPLNGDTIDGDVAWEVVSGGCII